MCHVFEGVEGDLRVVADKELTRLGNEWPSPEESTGLPADDPDTVAAFSLLLDFRDDLGIMLWPCV